MIPNVKKMQKMINDAILAVKKAENPIGHIRMETTNTNPNKYLGFGTWVLWGSGRVPVGVNTSDTSFNTVEKTGGEKTHKLTVAEIPSHQHNLSIVGGGSTQASAVDWTTVNTSRKYAGDMIEATGGNGAHNNLQPYITCYMWKRTA